MRPACIPITSASVAEPSARVLTANRVVAVVLIGATGVFIVAGAGLRARVAREWTWQCDEIPLIMRFTGICGVVSNEAEARAFEPSLFTLRHGAIRSLRARPDIAALHTTIGFWANLGIHTFGCRPWAARVGPWCFSVLGIFTAGWGAWILTRRSAAVCVAATFVALSPHAAFYAAQARGYAEAYALAGLLMVLLELVRRRPDRWWPAAAAALCAIHLCLALFSAFIYWVVPLLAVAWLCAGRRGTVPGSSSPGGGGAAGSSRAVISALSIGVLAVMLVYSLDRWNSVTFVAGAAGERIDGVGSLAGLLVSTCDELMPIHAGIALLAFPGAVLAWKSQQRWWLLAVVASAGAAGALVVVLGTPGYTRSFGVWLVPMAVLVAAGVDVVARAVRAAIPGATAPIMGCLLFLTTAALAHARLEPTVRRMVLPDWGAFVNVVTDTPAKAGPPWICRDLANHWTVAWYAPADPPPLAEMSPGDGFELVFGSQHDSDGRAVVFRPDRTATAIGAEPLPAWLAAIAPETVIGGVEARRWQAVHIETAEASVLPEEAPTYVVALGALSERQQQRMLVDSAAYDLGVVTFKSFTVRGQPAQGMLAPARAVGRLVDAMGDVPGLNHRVFALREAVAATTAARDEPPSAPPAADPSPLDAG